MAKTILEARVKQKTDTLANWMANDLILLDGEQAFVVSNDGSPVNFKIGDGTKTFAELPFWIAYDQSSFVAVSGSVLPASDGNVHYSIVTAGTYTQAGGADVVVDEGSFGIIANDGTSWSLVDMGELPVNPAADVVVEGGDEATSQDAVYQYVKPLYDLTVESANLSDNVFELGAYDAETGNPQSSINAKRLPTITITEDLVGQHWINGRGVLSTTHAFVIVRTPVSNPPVISIAGQGSSDDLSPITFTITPEMVGMMLRIGVGIIEGFEPPEGYENTFTWNMGAEPMPYFIPKDKLVIDGKNVTDVYTTEQTYSKQKVDALLTEKASETDANGKIVRAQEIKEYEVIAGTTFGNDSGYYIWNTGALPSSLTGWKRKLVPIEGTEIIAFSGISYSATNVAGVVFFDEEMTYLGYAERTYPDGDAVLDRVTIPYPAATRFIGTQARNADEYPVIEKVTETGEYEENLFKQDLTITSGVVTEIAGIPLAATAANIPFSQILAFGDSTTQGADLPNQLEDRWTTLLQNKLDIPITNYGFSGARAEEITWWQGGISVDVTLNNTTIPATGSRVGITYNGEFNPFRASTVPSTDAYVILQDGTLVSGNLNRTSGFMQNGETPIDTGNGMVRVTAKNLKQYSALTNLMIVSFGANNTTLINNETQTVDQLMKWYSDFASQHPNCLIWSQNIRTSGELAICLAVEDYLEKQFGSRFCNMRKYLASEKALEDAQIIDPDFTPSADDYTDVSNGLIPRGFKFAAGSAHVNELGHKLQANYLYAHIQLYFL